MEIKEKLYLLRNILFKSFVVGLLFLFAAILIYMPCKCLIAEIYQTKFMIPVGIYYAMWVSFIGLIKTILIFLFLVPSIAVHLCIKQLEKQS